MSARTSVRLDPFVTTSQFMSSLVKYTSFYVVINGKLIELEDARTTFNPRVPAWIFIGKLDLADDGEIERMYAVAYDADNRVITRIDVRFKVSISKGTYTVRLSSILSRDFEAYLTPICEHILPNDALRIKSSILWGYAGYVGVHKYYDREGVYNQGDAIHARFIAYALGPKVTKQGGSDLLLPNHLLAVFRTNQTSKIIHRVDDGKFFYFIPGLTNPIEIDLAKQTRRVTTYTSDMYANIRFGSLVTPSGSNFRYYIMHTPLVRPGRHNIVLAADLGDIDRIQYDISHGDCSTSILVVNDSNAWMYLPLEEVGMFKLGAELILHGKGGSRRYNVVQAAVNFTHESFATPWGFLPDFYEEEPDISPLDTIHLVELDAGLIIEGKGVAPADLGSKISTMKCKTEYLGAMRELGNLYARGFNVKFLYYLPIYNPGVFLKTKSPLFDYVYEFNSLVDSVELIVPIMIPKDKYRLGILTRSPVEVYVFDPIFKQYEDLEDLLNRVTSSIRDDWKLIGNVSYTKFPKLYKTTIHVDGKTVEHTVVVPNLIYELPYTVSDVVVVKIVAKPARVNEEYVNYLVDWYLETRGSYSLLEYGIRGEGQYYRIVDFDLGTKTVRAEIKCRALRSITRNILSSMSPPIISFALFLIKDNKYYIPNIRGSYVYEFETYRRLSDALYVGYGGNIYFVLDPVAEGTRGFYHIKNYYGLVKRDEGVPHIVTRPSTRYMVEL